jgi:oxygen-independent coproporphyrinogen-3 oxidase
MSGFAAKDQPRLPNPVDGRLPIAGYEQLTDSQRHVERILLGLRTRQGIDQSWLTPTEQARARKFCDTGLLTTDHSRLVCTDRGRLFVDGIVRDLIDDVDES